MLDVRVWTVRYKQSRVTYKQYMKINTISASNLHTRELNTKI
jgi:hypothetical protein